MTGSYQHFERKRLGLEKEARRSSEGIVFAYSSRDVPQGPTSSRGRSSTIHARERPSKRGWEPVFPGFFARSFTCVVPGAHHADFMQIQFLHLARHLPVGVVECG